MLALSFSAIVSLFLAGCVSSENEIQGTTLTLDEPFVHRGIKIKAWRSPPFDEKTEQPITELSMLVSGPGWRRKRWVNLLQGQSFEGLTLESFDARGDAIVTPNGPVVPLLIQGFTLKIEDGEPKRYVILRDFCGDAAFAFYSDEANPPLKH